MTTCSIARARATETQGRSATTSTPENIARLGNSSTYQSKPWQPFSTLLSSQFLKVPRRAREQPKVLEATGERADESASSAALGNVMQC